MAGIRLPNGQTLDEKQVRSEWEERIESAKRDRARFEPVWHSNLAFAAGKHHLQWHRFERRLVLPDLEDGKSRYTADVITERRNTALGEFAADDHRPELQFRQEDVDAEEYTAQANVGLEYGWDSEWKGDERLLDLVRVLIDLGTAAIETQFDPTAGPVRVRDIPHRDGKPIVDPEEARAYVAERQEAGESADLRPIHEGRIRWRVRTPFNLLTPPGVEHEDDFPWEVVVSPEHLDRVKDEYGDAAKDVTADEDVGVVTGLGSKELGEGFGRDPDEETGQPGKLENHVWLYTCYERPCSKYPNGRTIVLASNKFVLLSYTESLPAVGPDQTPRSNLAYYHWWRVTGRFWGRALLEPMKDPQRSINKRSGQIDEIIDRGMPFVLAREGSIPHEKRGIPLEIVEVKKDESDAPQIHEGIGPGAWMYEDIRRMKEDLETGSGIRAVSLGENPAGVQNYSQLALLRENDQTKLKPTIKDFQLALARTVENTVDAMRRYWGTDKQLVLAGDDGMVQSHVFNASKLPPFFLVKVPSGSAKPRSQAADLKLIDDIAQYSVNARQPLPVQWLADSYEAGHPLPIPELPTDDQLDKARLENELLMAGQEVQPAYYDNALVHIPEHRSTQIQAEMTGDMELWQRAERHILMHERLEEQKALIRAAQPTPQPAQQQANGRPPAQT